MNLLTLVTNAVVERNNNLRFNTHECFELVLESTISQHKKIIFLINVFDWSLSTCQEIVKRSEDESFVTITNDLNIRGLLN